ncbi:uncharacterized protein [Gossypium hirsutum]|uniref:Uncharacterized protein LOC107925231 n=1 Tax=Gossypium hirsutum TaxID=3635 RepID=A0A1U8L9T3_GOSHI|nr:uncharacterized protein LOC107925231 isoform X1 [Gossypium hirsutum]XP_016711370.1 uncharacterized protein LOC107925231 isoform X1 [Gossypium hirsutum]XP_016711377.1 uncharacterized protein LOC107925231 isoform X1 [Gossypium hirsutum]
MDATRGIMSGTMDRFKKVFEKKSNRKIMGWWSIAWPTNLTTPSNHLNFKEWMAWNLAPKAWHHVHKVPCYFTASTKHQIINVHVGEYGVNWNMEFNILALFSHQDELCFRNSNTLCVCMCVFFLCIKLHIESMFMY